MTESSEQKFDAFERASQQLLYRQHTDKPGRLLTAIEDSFETLDEILENAETVRELTKSVEREKIDKILEYAEKLRKFRDDLLDGNDSR